MGFSQERITVVQNAIDTTHLRSELIHTSESSEDKIRLELNLSGITVGLFCGAMYREKRLRFLADACLIIRRRLPTFEMIFIGEGPDADIIHRFCSTHEWAHYVGPKYGATRIPYFKLAHAFLMPGLVGLAVLDSFALETPMITTDYAYHSPEIEYLQDGINGVKTENSTDAFVNAVLTVLEDTSLRNSLVAGGRSSALEYTVQNMAIRFADGIESALACRN
jgi:glycosyltransferase involved in cell wall biosynthesis